MYPEPYNHAEKNGKDDFAINVLGHTRYFSFFSMEAQTTSEKRKMEDQIKRHMKEVLNDPYITNRIHLCMKEQSFGLTMNPILRVFEILNLKSIQIILGSIL